MLLAIPSRAPFRLAQVRLPGGVMVAQTQARLVARDSSHVGVGPVVVNAASYSAATRLAAGVTVTGKLVVIRCGMLRSY